MNVWQFVPDSLVLRQAVAALLVLLCGQLAAKADERVTDFVILLDTSTSMNDTLAGQTYGQKSGWEALKYRLSDFIVRLPNSSSWKVIVFNARARPLGNQGQGDSEL